ncbi:hypothetical protein BCR36DRAFT_582876 [Piromyces finnis]|uniref:RRM Nup35-type domain-containing protein n=1 Tax=Piromyces finnis TaxID=1754191 RepID=A0A1Y1VDB7_9FUNG|nr:hypothetical protein BCR36DRAFT_582876 [Piromyces finnis]|eukprot:ORX51837.1 hypothetical protein BCR36DRAFT_582876 [Piromyces finnis]
MSIPLPVAGGKISFSDWPKNNQDNEQRLSNKEKVFSRISNKYQPFKNNSEKNHIQDPFNIEEENVDKSNEYVSSFLSKLPIHKNQSPKKNKSNNVNGISYGESYYKGVDGNLLYDGPPHVTLDELSSSPEKQPFSSKLKTMSFLPNFSNQDNNLLNSPINNNNLYNNNNNNDNKINSLFGNKIQSQINNNSNSINNNSNNNSIFNSTPLNINKNPLYSSPNRNHIVNPAISNDINKNLNSIVIYGYPTFLENDILNHFKSYGEISSYESLNENNWIIITYRNSYSTKNAMQKNKNPFFFKNNIMGIMTHYDYTQLLKSNQYNISNNSTNSIFQSNSTLAFQSTNPVHNNSTINNINSNSIFNTTNNSMSLWNNKAMSSTLNFTPSEKENSFSNSIGNINNESNMNVDNDISMNNHFSNLSTNSINSTFKVHNSSNNLFKKNTVLLNPQESIKKNSQLSNELLNSNSNSSNTHINNFDINPKPSIFSNSNNNNNIGKPLLNSSFSPGRNTTDNNVASSSTKPKVSFAMNINDETIQNKTVYNKNNPFINLLNEENNAKMNEEKTTNFNKRSSFFHNSHHSSSSLNEASSSITIPKIGSNKISKPKPSSSIVKDNNPGLLGKMVELVFGW